MKGQNKKPKFQPNSALISGVISETHSNKIWFEMGSQLIGIYAMLFISVIACVEAITFSAASHLTAIPPEAIEGDPYLQI